LESERKAWKTIDIAGSRCGKVVALRPERLRLRWLIAVATAAVLLQGAAAVGQSTTLISLDQAINLALAHNHALKAARTQISQSQAEEITANLRPNPTIGGDAQFIPIFQPDNFSSDYLNEGQQFDLGIGYLFERGHKRQHRLQAARDLTAVTRSQVSDLERTVSFSVGQQFVAVLLAESTLQFSLQDLKDFQQTVDIAEAQYKAGAISEGDFLKIKLQLLQFQTDVSAARLARVQALVGLRELLGYSAVPADYDVIGDLTYQPLKAKVEDLQAKALSLRPDLRAAQLGVTAAQSQLLLAKANGKQDVSGTADYTHTGGLSTASLFVSIPLPIFDRNQGEIARSRYAVTQAQESEQLANDAVLGDVSDAYEAVKSNDEIVQLYQSGYLKQAQDSRDISEYAYHRGAASLLDFLDAERSYRATQLAYRQALASYMTSLEQLKDAVGTRNLP
jgi:cobalt-zinc-cadmium efflux system outer membrane protein